MGRLANDGRGYAPGLGRPGGLIWMAFRKPGTEPGEPGEPSAADILDTRFARGEIDESEWSTRRGVITWR